MNKLQIVLFRDGRPGHEKQSLGILQALEEYLKLDITEIVVKKNGFFSDFIQYFKYFIYQNGSLELEENPDLIIGTGSRTHLSILSCKRKFGGRAITCMSPSKVLRDSFDLCFVPIHDQLSPGKTIFKTVGPPNNAKNLNLHDNRKSLILVGGEDSGSHRWNSSTLIENIKKLLTLSTEQHWTISSSPRTPVETEDLLYQLAEESNELAFIPFSQTGQGWVEKQYTVNRTVWVTGDSISMVYEALSAGCCVGILPVDWHKQENKFRLSLQYLIDNKRVITLRQHEDGMPFPEEMEPLHEADRCAREILRRWWPESLR